MEYTNAIYRPVSPSPHTLHGEKNRDPYDGLRPWSAITHGIGAVLSLLGTVLLLVCSVSMGLDRWHLVPFAVYGCSMIGLYTASTLYHCLNTSVAGRLALRKYDHCSIALLIAGSYTPICLTALRTQGAWGWAIFGVIWAMALASCCLSLLWISSPRWLTSGVYLVMGWLALFALYAVKWPGRNNPRFGCHEVFHLFILAGSVCHFFLMYRVIRFL